MIKRVDTYIYTEVAQYPLKLQNTISLYKYMYHWPCRYLSRLLDFNVYVLLIFHRSLLYKTPKIFDYASTKFELFGGGACKHLIKTFDLLVVEG